MTKPVQRYPPDDEAVMELQRADSRAIQAVVGIARNGSPSIRIGVAEASLFRVG